MVIDRELCHREVKPFWWCIGDECKHVCRLFGKKDCVDNNRCVHPTIVKQLPENMISIMGYPVKDMKMCPILTDVEI
jgi:hypothetical protein